MAQDDESETAGNTDRAGVSHDYSIYLHFDGIKASAPWKIADYGSAGALTAEQRADLGERFSLDPTNVEQLSERLGYCLDAEAEVNLAAVSRATAIERARSRLERAAKRAARAEQDLRAIVDEITPLSACFAEERTAETLLETAQSHAERASAAADGLRIAVERVLEIPDAAADLAPLDKRRLWDKRRQYVVETCCFAWQAAGNRITYTTAPDRTDGQQRHGRLIEFIQAVVGMLSDPPTELSEETVRKDIDRFKRQQAEPDPLSMPSDGDD